MARRLLRSQAGLSLIEAVVSLALASLVLAGIGSVLVAVLTIPGQGIARLAAEQGMRNLATWVRNDGANAESFNPGSGTVYGTFHWLDRSTFPPTRRSAAYYWDNETVFRMLTTEGVPEDPIPLARNVLDPADAVFSVVEEPHVANPDSLQHLLVMGATATVDDRVDGPVPITQRVEVHLRPEQLHPAEYLALFLHNNPTPPTADTVSQLDLPMDGFAPTAATLYNYDTDNDAYPGREIRRAKQGGEIGATDTRKFQDWLSQPFPASTTVDGRASLFLSSAAGGFNTGLLQVLDAWLFDYDPVGDTNTLIISRGFAGFTTQATWSKVGLHFRPTVYTLAPGHRLRLKVQMDGISDPSISTMLAYDTLEHRSVLLLPVQPSALTFRDFTDIHLGGTTSGTVIDTGGLTLDIDDLPSPAGFRIRTSGGAGTAKVQACGYTVFYTDGDDATLTCSSLDLDVRVGPVEVDLPGGFQALVPTSHRGTFSKRDDGGTSITSAPGSSGKVKVTKGALEVEIEPGQELDLSPFGLKQQASALLFAHEHSSLSLRRARQDVERSISVRYWLDRQTLDPDDGERVFEEEENAAHSLEWLLGSFYFEFLPPEAQDATLNALLLLVAADESLARTALDLSLATPTLDPDKEAEVAQKRSFAQGAIAQGDAAVADEEYEDAIGWYKEAWEYAQEALEKQAEAPRGGDDDDDDDDNDDDDDRGGGRGGRGGDR
jgi:hypothetical protein